MNPSADRYYTTKRNHATVRPPHVWCNMTSCAKFLHELYCNDFKGDGIPPYNRLVADDACIFSWNWGSMGVGSSIP